MTKAKKLSCLMVKGLSLPVLFLLGAFTNASAQVDYGDLVLLYRHDTGVPILDLNSCQQPLAFNSDACPTETLNCTEQDPCLVPLNSDAGEGENPCEIEVGYEACAREVEFGRINVARAPDTVFENQLEDVAATLGSADCATLDPAGRMVAITMDEETGLPLVSTIDSPLQNLAIYRQIMLQEPLGFPVPPGSNDMQAAFRGLGAAAGKEDHVNVDVVVYLNQIMGLPDEPGILLDKICIDINEEVNGVMTLVEKCFLDYSSFSYTRANNFSTSSPSLPRPPYMPEGSPDNGVFEYLVEASPEPLFSIQTGPILDAVFCVDSSGDMVVLDASNAGVCPETVDSGFTGGNIGGFAQAADDTRAVINFMHSTQVPGIPGGYETLPACDLSAFYPIVTPEGKAAVINL